jgi:hypothetical protein
MVTWGLTDCDFTKPRQALAGMLGYLQLVEQAKSAPSSDCDGQVLLSRQQH